MPSLGKFFEFSQEASKDGSISAVQKELIAIAIGIYARCEYCIVFHVKAALKIGATPDQIREAAEIAVLMGGGPSMAYAVTIMEQSLEAFGQ